MESCRRAALCLHALAPADRRWMLRRLSPRHTPALRAMLSELEAMGIPREPDLLPALDAEKMPQTLLPGNAAQRRFAIASASEIAHVLRDEPLEIVAAVLNTGDWEWKAAFIESFEPSDGHRWPELLEHGQDALPEAVQECLVLLVERHLPQACVNAPKASGDKRRNEHDPWWKRLIGGVPWPR